MFSKIFFQERPLNFSRVHHLSVSRLYVMLCATVSSYIKVQDTSMMHGKCVSVRLFGDGGCVETGLGVVN